MCEYKKADVTHSAKKVILKTTLVLLTNARFTSLPQVGGKKDGSREKGKYKRTCTGLLSILTKKPPY